MFKKTIIITIVSIIISLPALAETKDGSVEYSDYQYSFSKSDAKTFLPNAEKNIKQYEKYKDTPDGIKYLQEALRNYFMLSKFDPSSIDAQIGMGRVFDLVNLDKYAKEHFYNAYNVNPENPELNLYLGDFYFKRDDFINAVKYYKFSYTKKYSSNYYLNYQLGLVYEKLGDISNSLKYYKKALSLNKTNSELSQKINLLDMSNYSSSQYYLFQKK